MIPLEVQRAIVERHRRSATHALLGFLGRYQDQIEAMALERLSALGFEQYGDESFRKSHGQLWQDTMEELADAVVYRCVRLAMDAGEL